MKNTILNITLLSCVAISAHAAYSGYVFTDKNTNGTFDKGEKAMPGVLVSDGLNVVKTARDGSFTLPGHAKEKFLFITTPSGYKTDNAYYQRIETGKASYDFALQPYNGSITKDGSHNFIQISDTEIHNSPVAEHDDWVQNLRDYSANEGAAFIIHTGDICYDSGLINHISLLNTANMNTQAFYCIGNHDLVKGEYGEALFEKYYGPTFYSFDAGNVHYIVTPMLGGDYRPSYTKEDVYRWLKNDLAQIPAGKPIMVFNHDLLTTDESFLYGISDQETIDLDAHNLKAWLYGHWHINHIQKHKQAYSICTSTLIRGGIDHSTSGFRVMKVDPKGDFTSDLRYTYIDKSVKIASVGNLQAPVLPSGEVPLSVNAYSAISPVSSVTYACRVEGETVCAGKPMKQQTDFNWYAAIPLPARLAGRFVTVAVEARFANGEVARAERSFTYQPDKASEVSLQGDWTNLLSNPQHLGIAPDSLSAPLTLAWVQNIGSNVYMTSPIVSQGAVYMASMDENAEGKAAIVSMDARTGSINWKYPVRNSVKNTISASGGLLLAQDVEGYLYAIDAASGKLAWEKKLSTRPVVPALIDGLVTSGEVVYAGSGKGLCAIDLKSGKELWRNQSWGQHEGTTATLSVNNSILIGSAHWGALYANDATNGKLLWSAEKDGIRHRSSSAVMQGNVCYLASDQSLFVMDARTGQILIRKELPYSVNVASCPLITEKEIIVGTATDGIVAFDRETLTEKWNFRTGPALIYTAPYFRNPSCTVESSPVLAGETVFFGASDGIVYALDREKGTLRWKHATGAPVLGTVAISGNTLFVADFSGNVYAFVEECP